MESGGNQWMKQNGIYHTCRWSIWPELQFVWLLLQTLNKACKTYDCMVIASGHSGNSAPLNNEGTEVSLVSQSPWKSLPPSWNKLWKPLALGYEILVCRLLGTTPTSCRVVPSLALAAERQMIIYQRQNKIFSMYCNFSNVHRPRTITEFHQTMVHSLI